MSSMTNAFENLLVDHLFRTTAYTRPTNLVIRLYTATPGETGGGTAVTGGSYADQSLPPGDANWTATQGGTSGVSSGTGGVTSNAVAITFPTPTANWGTVVGVGVLDQAGTLLFYGPLAQSKIVSLGDPAPYFAPGALTLTLA